jgi:predicted transcriptional regulator
MLYNIPKELILMTVNRGLKNRKAISTAIDIKLARALDNLSEETRIPKSKLLDEAIADLLKKHGKLID